MTSDDLRRPRIASDCLPTQVRKMRRGEFDEFYDHDLRQAFERFGNLVRAEIALDKDTGVSKGFGFVSYSEVAAADAAMAAMNGAMVAGRQVRIKKTSELRLIALDC